MPDIPMKQKTFSASAPTLISFWTGTGGMDPMQGPILVNAEQNLDDLTTQRGNAGFTVLSTGATLL